MNTQIICKYIYFILNSFYEENYSLMLTLLENIMTSNILLLISES